MYKNNLLLVAVLFPCTAQVKAPVTPVGREPVPLTQIAFRAEELSQTLRELTRHLPHDTELTEFDKGLQQQEEEVRVRELSSSEAMTSGAIASELREQILEWRAWSRTESQQRRVLNDWGIICEGTLTRVASERDLWAATLKLTQTGPALTSLEARVNSGLQDIEALRTVAEQRLRMVLELQARISKRSATIAGVLERLIAHRQEFQQRLFIRDAAPIWVPPTEVRTGTHDGIVSGTISRLRTTLSKFVTVQPGLPFAVVLVITITLGITLWIRRRALRVPSTDEIVLLARRLLNRPVALAILLSSPLACVSSPLAQTNVVFVLAQSFLIPIARLLPLYVQAKRLLYFFVGFYVLNGLIGILDADAYLRRQIVLGVYAAAACVLAWLGRPVRIRGILRETHPDQEVVWARIWLLPVALVCLLNVFGFLQLGHLLRVGVFLCASVGLVLYTLVRVLITLFRAAIKAHRIRSLASIRLHEAGVVRWTARVFALCAFLCWFYVILTLFEAQDAVSGSVRGLLEARTHTRAFDFSVGDVLGFLSVLVIGYLVASGVRFVLREEVLPHWPLARGVPETISSSFYYVLLLLVFFMSLNAAGIQLDKLTVLTGAFGVGIGFGLQNVVNNFVSGLILQFERPIRVGDVLEVGPHAGEIRRIGIRASTMRTAQGAEVVIPNSAFVSERFINWTLSEAVRRVDITVPVAYGTNPERVIQMLLEIAASHADVLKRPEPFAVFQGFGESSLDFLLMFWATQDTHFQLRSDVSIHINRALNEAAISIPFPQREIRIHPSQSSTFGHSA